MQTRILALLLFIISLSSSGFSQPVESLLTFEGSISLGLKNNQEILKLNEKAALARQRLNEVKAISYPKVDFNMNASKINSDTPSILASSFGSAFLPPTVNDDHISTKVSLWQYLYAGGRYSTNLKVAQANLSQNRSNVEMARNRIIKEIAKKFYECLVLKEKVMVYSKYCQKMKTENNPSALKTEYEYRTINHEYEKSKLEFLNSIGLELDVNIDISGELSAPKEEYDLNKCLAWASQYRMELNQSEYQETIDTLKINLSTLKRFPTITLGANYEWVDSQFPLNNENWNATINLNIPLSEALSFWSRMKQKKFQAREGVLQKAEVEDRINLEVRKAYMDYDFWRKQIKFVLENQAKSKLLRDELLNKIMWMDTVENALCAKAELDWAIGKSLSEHLIIIGPAKK